MQYVARGRDGRRLALVTSRVPWFPGSSIELVTGKILVRIEGPRSAWDHIPIRHPRDSSRGRLTVIEAQWWERDGVEIPER